MRSCSTYCLLSQIQVVFAAMCRKFILIFAVILPGVLSRPTGVHNPSICLGQSPSDECEQLCASNNNKQYCEVKSVHICVCQYPGKDTDDIAVIIKPPTRITLKAQEEQLVPDTPPTYSANSPPVSPTDSHTIAQVNGIPYEQDEEITEKPEEKQLVPYTAPASLANLPPVSPTDSNIIPQAKDISYVPQYDLLATIEDTTDTGLVVGQPQPESGEQKVVLREPGTLTTTYLGDFDQQVPDVQYPGEQTESPISIDEASQYQNDAPINVVPPDAHNVQEKQLNADLKDLDLPDDEENSLTSALYKKYLEKEKNLWKIVTSQTFMILVVLAYFAVIVIYLCVRTHNKKKYIRVPLTYCSETQY